jgi:hypothetical protein
MDVLMIFYSTIKDGKLNIHNRKRFLQDVSTLKNGEYELRLKKKNRRSLQQNKYYWGVIVFEITHRFNELGNEFTHEMTHDFLKDRFNFVEVVGTGGELIGTVGGTTTDLNKDEFSIYLDKIIQWAGEFLEIIIPAAGEQTEMTL